MTVLDGAAVGHDDPKPASGRRLFAATALASGLFVAWLVAPGPGFLASREVPRAAGPVAAQASGENRTSVGAANMVAAPAQQALNTKADGSLRLSGIVATAGNRFDALIALDGGPEELRSAGAALGRHGVLQAVFVDRILVEREGVVRTIRLAEAQRGADQPATVPVPGPDGSVPAVMPLAYPPGPLPASLGGTASEQYVLSRADLKTGLSFPKVAAQATMAVYPQGGFQFVEVGEGSLLEKLGVQPGDVVRSVNGRQLAGIADVMAVQELLPAAEWVKVEIVRNGQLQTWEQKIRD